MTTQTDNNAMILIDRKVHRQVKVLAAYYGQPMKRLIEKFITEGLVWHLE